MVTLIQNAHLSACIDSAGGQLVSVKDAAGKELLWTADPAVWDWHAPVLFPYCGLLRGDRFLCSGKEYKGEMHGFMRYVQHRLASRSADRAVLEAASTPDTLGLYPFPFLFTQEFCLDGTALTHSVTVKNTGRGEMRFGLGFHPGVLLPLGAGQSTEDCYLEFDTPQSPVRVFSGPDRLLNGQRAEYAHAVRRIALNDSLFDNKSIALTGLSAKSISLCVRGCARRITFDIEGFPYVLLWSKPTKPLRFLCVEPWLCLQDSALCDGDWAHKPDLVALPAGESYTKALRIHFDV